MTDDKACREAFEKWNAAVNMCRSDDKLFFETWQAAYNAQRDDSADEAGWAIEADGAYWNGRALDSSAFVKDHNEAVRFARHEDAERIKYWLLRTYAFALRTTQHVWVGKAPLPAPPAAVKENES